MATKNDLIGLHLPSQVANVLGMTPIISSAAGDSVGAATQIGSTDYLFVVGTGTSGVALPRVGGGPTTINSNALLGGPGHVVANRTGASIKVYAANDANGSAVFIMARGASVTGVTGASVEAGMTMVFFPITASAWVAIGGASA